MSETTELLKHATELLSPMDVSAHQLRRADSLARIATAQALEALAQDTVLKAAGPWPEGITARFLTRGGILTGDRTATVDIHDTPHRSVALCRPCGWTDDHHIDDRGKVLAAAQEHADQCTALPHPAA